MIYLKVKHRSDPPIYNEWLENVNKLKEFAKNRPEYFSKYVLEYVSE